MAASDPTSSAPGDDAFPLTTMHVARAVGGDERSLEWLVARLSPLLRSHATYRLGAVLRRHYDPDDLVNDAWLATLPRLTELLASPERRRTPVLLKYLSSTVVLRIRHLARRHAARADAADSAPPVAALAAADSGTITRAVRSEQRQQLGEALDELDQRDREVLLLRGIEQLPAKAVAALLGLGVEAVHKRYQRALHRLRERLPESAFVELDD